MNFPTPNQCRAYVKRRMRQRGLTQKEVARRARWYQPSLSAWLSGRREIEHATMRRVLGAVK